MSTGMESRERGAEVGSGPVEALTWLLVAVGILLRTWQFAGSASLYLDEVSVARNVADRSYGELLAPLAYGQVAPPAWLLVERLLWSWFGTDWSLRIASFAAAVASVLTFRAIARRMVTGLAIPFAVGAFAVGVPFILYGAQVKQYAGDVAFALALQLLTLRVVDHGREGNGGGAPARGDTRVRAEWQAAVLGLVAVWFSNAAIIVVTGMGAVLVVLAMRGELVAPRRVIVRVVVPWGVAAIAAGLASRALVSPDTMEFMRHFWGGVGSLGPRAPFGWRDLLWPLGRLNALLSPPAGLGYPGTWLYTILALLGTWRLWQGRRAHALILTGPILVTLVVALLQLYPFSNRLVLFLTPAVIVAIAAGAGQVADWCAARHRAAGVAVLAVLALGPVLRIATQRPVYRLQEAERLLAWLQERRRPGDDLFVWYRLLPNFLWYAPSYGIVLDEVRWGGCRLDDPRRFLRDLDPLRGRRRVWILLAGVGARETTYLLSYADSIGRRIEGQRFNATLPGYLPLEAALYDLGDPARLSRFSAETMPLTIRPQPPEALLGCTIGPMSARPPSASATRKPSP